MLNLILLVVAGFQSKMGFDRLKCLIFFIFLVYSTVSKWTDGKLKLIYYMLLKTCGSLNIYSENYYLLCFDVTLVEILTFVLR